MLGGAILLIVVVLFFGIRAFMGSGKGDSSKDTADEQVTADNDQGNVPSSPANDGETDGKKDANPMETAACTRLSLLRRAVPTTKRESCLQCLQPAAHRMPNSF